MPPYPIYILRLRISSPDKVSGVLLRPDLTQEAEDSWDFAYQGPARQAILDLQEAARQAAKAQMPLPAPPPAADGADCLPENAQSGAQKLGELLYLALLGGIQGRFVEWYRKIRDQKAVLRLEIEVELDEHTPAPQPGQASLVEIAGLPWEFLHATGEVCRQGLGWLGTAPDVVVARRIFRKFAPPPVRLKPNEKLRIALAISAPSGEYWDDYLNDTVTLGKVEYLPVQNMLEDLARHSPLLVQNRPTIVNPATASAIQESLQQSSRPHIFHYVGHARFNRTKNIAEVALTSAEIANTPQWTPAAAFSELIAASPPQIVILQACESAAEPERWAFGSVAAALAERNIPVVVAMQFEVSNDTALSFVSAFYQHLIQERLPVDRAVQEGRQAIHGQNEKPDFATPVLFMWPESGALFNFSERAGAGPADDGGQILYNSLRQLNYGAIEYDFTRCISNSNQSSRAAVVVVNSTEEQEWLWVLNRLARLNRPDFSFDPYRVARYPYTLLTQSREPLEIMRTISQYFQVSDPLELPKHLAENVLGTQNVFIILRKVKAAFVPDLLQNFWRPLAEAAAKRPAAAEGFLILFIWVSDPTPFTEAGAGGDWPELVILDLPNPITEKDLARWLRSEKDNLPALAGLDAVNLQALLSRIVQNGSSLENVLESLCSEILGESYSDKEEDWLKLK